MRDILIYLAVIFFAGLFLGIALSPGLHIWELNGILRAADAEESEASEDE